MNTEAYDLLGWFRQSLREGRYPGKKCKSVYVGISEERGVGGMTGFHVRK